MPAPRPIHRRRRAVLAAGVVVLGVVVLGVVSVGTRPAGPAPIARVARQPDLAPWVDIRWELLAPPAMGGALNQSLYQIVGGGPGYAVLGADSRGTAGAQTSMAAVWTSSDGREWRESLLVDGLANADSSQANVIAATPTALVVTGGVCCAIGEQQAMWWSADGLAWERLVLPLEMQGVTFLSMAGGPSGFVGAGVSHEGNPNDPTERGELWTSPNGRVWTRVDTVAAGIDLGTLADVAWTGTHWLAVGKQAAGETWDGAVWRSPDLTGWSRVAARDPVLVGDDEVELHRVVPFAGGILAAGGRGTHDDRVRCEEGLGVVGEPDAVLANSCGWLRAEHLWSIDGLEWRRLEPIEAPARGPALRPGPGGRRLISHRVIAAGGPGLVVVDEEDRRQDLQGSFVGAWTSVDGETWRPVGPAPDLPRGLYLNDMIVSGRTIIGIGDAGSDQPDGPDGLVWIGTVVP